MDLPQLQNLQKETITVTPHLLHIVLYSKLAELTAMNPPGYPAESVQLQVGRCAGPVGQPVQHTAVNIINDPPRDDILWSICSFAYMNACCLGLAALIHSIKSRDMKMAGDLQGAQHYGSTARHLNIASTIICSILFFISIIVIIMVFKEINTFHRFS